METPASVGFSVNGPHTRTCSHIGQRKHLQRYRASKSGGEVPYKKRAWNTSDKKVKNEKRSDYNSHTQNFLPSFKTPLLSCRKEPASFDYHSKLEFSPSEL